MQTAAMRVTVIGVAAVAAGVAVGLIGCDRSGDKSVYVPAATLPKAPTAQELEAVAETQRYDNLEMIPELGIAQAVKMNDNETWSKYTNGLMMYDIRPGSGMRPQVGMTAHVRYKGTFPDGKVFDEAKDPPFTFVVGSKSIIKGWNLAISTMAIGGKRKIFVPSALAYGQAGNLPSIKPNQDLFFEIELLKLTGKPVVLPEMEKAQKEQAAKEAQEEAQSNMEAIPDLGSPVAEKLGETELWSKYPSGLKIYDERPGKGVRPAYGQVLHVKYKGTLADGTVFDQSSGDPFTFVLGTKNIIMGWNMGLQTMQVGGKRKIFIPAKLAYGERGSPPKIGPNQDLYFDIELVDVTGTPMQPPQSHLEAAVAGPSTQPAVTQK